MVASKSRLRVGSADDADIVIKQATVSRYHCEFRWVGGAWELHDLDSTNGTFVDGKQVTTPVRISSSALITLGRGVPLAIPAPPNAGQRNSGPANSGPGTVLETREQIASYLPAPVNLRGSNSNSALIYVLGTAVGMLMLGGIAFLIFQLGRQGALKTETVATNSSPSSQIPSDSGPNVKPDAGAVAATSNSSNSVPKVSSGEKKNDTTSPTPTKAFRECDPAFWAVIVESSDGKDRRLIGTAVAVEPKRLVTLASIVEALEACKAGYPKMVLAAVNGGRVLIPGQITTHPKRKQALANLDDFAKRLDEKSKSYDVEREAPTDDESIDWSGKYQSVMAEVVDSDLASISTTETLDKYYPIEKGDVAQQASSFVLRGFPMNIPPLDVPQDLSQYCFDVPVVLRKEAVAAQPALQVETSEVWDLPVISMVCLNAKSQVVGLCALEEPAKEQSTQIRSQLSRVEVFWK